MAVNFRYVVFITCIALLFFAHQANAFGAGSKRTPAMALILANHVRHRLHLCH